MRQCQTPCHPSPRLWLVSDARNDAVLERVLARMPRGSGLIFRHHHLAPDERRARFMAVARVARAHGHWLVLAGDMARARAWRADGAYGAPGLLARGPAGLRLVNVHDLREIGLGRRGRASAIVLSPAFATRSHPGAAPLGAVRWRLLAALAGVGAGVPVIALGGMTAARARWLGVAHWAAIDGLSGVRPAKAGD